MLSVIHLISAIRRLEETEKTILVMGGSRYHDRDVPMQLVAQRDMIKREVKYYKDRACVFGFICLFVVIGSVTILVPMHKLGII
jgi:hypothetical protein